MEENESGRGREADSPANFAKFKETMERMGSTWEGAAQKINDAFQGFVVALGHWMFPDRAIKALLESHGFGRLEVWLLMRSPRFLAFSRSVFFLGASSRGVITRKED